MSRDHQEIINKKWIISKRGKKNHVDPQKPYAWIVEKERTLSGEIEDTASIFLTNSECPFHCLMCDLWKNTTDDAVPLGAIPNQLQHSLQSSAPRYLSAHQSEYTGKPVLFCFAIRCCRKFSGSISIRISCRTRCQSSN